MRFDFIAENRSSFPVDLMCQALKVSRSGFHAWNTRLKSAAAQRRERLTEHIGHAHQESLETYGSPRIHRELKAQGVACRENTVAKLMRRKGLRSKAQRRFTVRTTDSRHCHPIAENTLNREFFVDKLDQVWASDLMYIATARGWLYLAVVID